MKKKRGGKKKRSSRKRSVTTTVCRKTTLQGVSRGDFNAIAEVLCRTGAPSGTTEGIARYFGSKNARFDQDRFVKAATNCKR